MELSKYCACRESVTFTFLISLFLSFSDLSLAFFFDDLPLLLFPFLLCSINHMFFLFFTFLMIYSFPFPVFLCLLLFLPFDDYSIECPWAELIDLLQSFFEQVVLGSHQRRSSSKAYWHHIRCGFAVLYMLTNCWLMLSRPHALDPWPISMILLWHSFSIETATTCPSTSVLVAFFIPYWAVKLNACHADSWHRLTVGAPWTGNARVVGVMAPTPWSKSKGVSFVSMRRGPKPCKSSICRPWINWLTVLLMVMSNIIDSCLSIRRIHLLDHLHGSFLSDWVRECQKTWKLWPVWGPMVGKELMKQIGKHFPSAQRIKCAGQVGDGARRRGRQEHDVLFF